MWAPQDGLNTPQLRRPSSPVEVTGPSDFGKKYETSVLHHGLCLADSRIFFMASFDFIYSMHHQRGILLGMGKYPDPKH